MLQSVINTKKSNILLKSSNTLENQTRIPPTPINITNKNNTLSSNSVYLYEKCMNQSINSSSKLKKACKWLNTYHTNSSLSTIINSASQKINGTPAYNKHNNNNLILSLLKYSLSWTVTNTTRIPTEIYSLLSSSFSSWLVPEYSIGSTVTLINNTYIPDYYYTHNPLEYTGKEVEEEYILDYLSTLSNIRVLS